jgi:hypothetical protein
MLLDGFDNDEIVVSVDGLERERRSAVSTSLLLGLADEMTLLVPSDAQLLQVSVSTKGNMSGEVALPEGDATFLASILSEDLQLALGTGREGFM